MKIDWSEEAWAEYLEFQKDKKTFKRINDLIKSLMRNGYDSIGKPERLRNNLSGFFSVRIDEKNRIIFIIENDVIYISQCGGHY